MNWVAVNTLTHHELKIWWYTHWPCCTRALLFYYMLVFHVMSRRAVSEAWEMFSSFTMYFSLILIPFPSEYYLVISLKNPYWLRERPIRPRYLHFIIHLTQDCKFFLTIWVSYGNRCNKEKKTILTGLLTHAENTKSKSPIVMPLQGIIMF